MLYKPLYALIIQSDDLANLARLFEFGAILLPRVASGRCASIWRFLRISRIE